MLFLSHDEKVRVLEEVIQRKLCEIAGVEMNAGELHRLVGYLFASHLVEFTPCEYKLRIQYESQLHDFYNHLKESAPTESV
ncbi:hypothetical protein LZP85_08450 [Priestia flexa]|uniref:hypothetical protein n=1 Tax=Priestia flexa TaxID=86664 RepID=UPI001A90840A|nr:hypothetical protein [Priestia flexa]MBN8434435.1 hypothetical protein [Priestia flexa]MCA0966781.1 hypothetical protein [Priestia flexa]UIR31790.1 hypothetical protein LZP85_08450 [Priestia flexa]UZW65470.1 hypothetical protein OC195_15260 [Priestia flexa]